MDTPEHLNEDFIRDAQHCARHLKEDLMTPATKALADEFLEKSQGKDNGTIIAACVMVIGFVLSEAKDKMFAYAMTAAIAAIIREIFDKVKASKEAVDKAAAPMKMIFTRRPEDN